MAELGRRVDVGLNLSLLPDQTFISAGLDFLNNIRPFKLRVIWGLGYMGVVFVCQLRFATLVANGLNWEGKPEINTQMFPTPHSSN